MIQNYGVSADADIAFEYMLIIITKTVRAPYFVRISGLKLQNKGPLFLYTDA